MTEYIITSEKVLDIMAKKAERPVEDFKVPEVVFMTFSRGTMERWGELCQLEDREWLLPQYHPYATPHVIKEGVYQDIPILVIVPPMADSTMACVLEDLVACGAKAIFLVCAAWSLGPPVKLTEKMIPAFSVGPDGTSIHYGNQTERVEANPAVVKALEKACQEAEVIYHVGGNGTCEALHRISPQMVQELRDQGCICMENGEANVMFSFAQDKGILAGVFFQSYIDLGAGWQPFYDENYAASARQQADIVLRAVTLLKGSF